MKIGSVYYIDGKYLELIRVELEFGTCTGLADATYIFRETDRPSSFVEEAIEVSTEEWTKIISST
jgi:hypothetical protein